MVVMHVTVTHLRVSSCAGLRHRAVGRTGGILWEAYYGTLQDFLGGNCRICGDMGVAHRYFLSFHLCRARLVCTQHPYRLVAHRWTAASASLIVQRSGCVVLGADANQPAAYSGYKRFHCLIYQTVATPVGLLFHMFGLEMGRQHDITLYRESGMDDTLLTALAIESRQ